MRQFLLAIMLAIGFGAGWCLKPTEQVRMQEIMRLVGFAEGKADAQRSVDRLKRELRSNRCSTCRGRISERFGSGVGALTTSTTFLSDDSSWSWVWEEGK